MYGSTEYEKFGFQFTDNILKLCYEDKSANSIYGNTFLLW
jgi:hypothetical protein